MNDIYNVKCSSFLKRWLVEILCHYIDRFYVIPFRFFFNVMQEFIGLLGIFMYSDKSVLHLKVQINYQTVKPQTNLMVLF